MDARQRMTREEALASFTRRAAYAAHAETLTGSIESGKLADLLVLSKDIMRVPPREILTTIVRMTIVAGEIVYEARLRQRAVALRCALFVSALERDDPAVEMMAHVLNSHAVRVHTTSRSPRNAVCRRPTQAAKL